MSYPTTIDATLAIAQSRAAVVIGSAHQLTRDVQLHAISASAPQNQPGVTATIQMIYENLIQSQALTAVEVNRLVTSMESLAHSVKAITEELAEGQRKILLRIDQLGESVAQVINSGSNVSTTSSTETVQQHQHHEEVRREPVAAQIAVVTENKQKRQTRSLVSSLPALLRRGKKQIKQVTENVEDTADNVVHNTQRGVNHVVDNTQHTIENVVNNVENNALDVIVP